MASRPLSDAEEAFVATRRLARLATASSDGEPHVVPVMYAWAEGAFWISSDPGDRKHRHLETNPRAALVVDEPPPAKSGVTIRGTVEILTGGPDFERAQDHLGSSRRMAPGEQVYFKLTPRAVASWRIPGR